MTSPHMFRAPAWPDYDTARKSFDALLAEVAGLLEDDPGWSPLELYDLFKNAEDKMPASTHVSLGALIATHPNTQSETLELVLDRVEEHDVEAVSRATSMTQGHKVVPTVAQHPNASTEVLHKCLYTRQDSWTTVVNHPNATAHTVALVINFQTIGYEKYAGAHADRVRVILRRVPDVGLALRLPKRTQVDFEEATKDVLQERNTEVEAWLGEHHPEMIGLPLEWVRGLLAVKD